MIEKLIFALEIIGTIAFAVSGAMVALEKKMDVLGVLALGLVTAVGGGIVRDIIIGVTPPTAFRKPVYAITALVVALIVFLPFIRKKIDPKSSLLLIMDSIGLGVFTVIGVQTAFSVTGGRNYFLVTFVGVLTGVGGGILRDVFAGDTPYIFVRHFYACASIAGAWICALLWDAAGAPVSMLTGAVAVLVLRLLAARYRWSLPKAQ